MADIELVVKISEDSYKATCNESMLPPDVENVVQGTKNGIPLPNVYGKLIDADALVMNIVKEYGVNSIHELPQNIKMFYNKFINSAPTILDATFNYQLKNYAFFRKEKEK